MSSSKEWKGNIVRVRYLLYLSRVSDQCILREMARTSIPYESTAIPFPGLTGYRGALGKKHPR